MTDKQMEARLGRSLGKLEMVVMPEAIYRRRIGTPEPGERDAIGARWEPFPHSGPGE